jgi:hypothetical protein
MSKRDDNIMNRIAKGDTFKVGTSKLQNALKHAGANVTDTGFGVILSFDGQEIFLSKESDTILLNGENDRRTNESLMQMATAYQHG